MFLDIFLILLIVVSFILIFSSSGCLFFCNTKDKKLILANPILIGFSIHLISLYIFFFNFKFNLSFSFIFSIIILLVLTFFSFKKNRIYVKKTFLENTFIVLPSGVIFTIFALIYGDNFYVFRGNHWDYFYYLSQSVLTYHFTYLELAEMQKSNFILSQYESFLPYYFDFFKNEFFFHNERVGIFLLYGSLFIFSFKNIFLASFIYKIFISSLAGCAFFSILRYIKREKKKFDILIISIIFTLSFWLCYLHESEALAQSAGVTIFIYLIFSTIKIHQNPNERFNIVICISGLLLSCLYILYFELFAITMFFYLFCITLNFTKFLKLLKQFSNYFLLIILYLFIIGFLSYENTLIPIATRLIKNIADTQATSGAVSLWGYYGAFALGKESIILNNDLINSLADIKDDQTNFALIRKIIYLNINNGFNYFYLNFLPSFSGLYHFGILKNTSNFFYSSLILNIFINLYLLWIFLRNTKSLLIHRNYLYKFFRNILLFLIIISLFFIYKNNFYPLIKIYFSFSFALFLFFSFRFLEKKNEINLLYLILILSFVSYKFTIDNNGISRIDSFPSIIKKQYKIDFNWKVNDNDLKNCKSLNNSIKKFEKDKFQWIKYNFINIRLYNYKFNNPVYNCEISEDEKRFIVINNH